MIRIVLFIFAAHQLTQKGFGLRLPLADNYLDPLLCMPLLLAGFSLQQRWLTGRSKLHFLEVLIATALVSFISEWVFPRLSAGFTADPLDVAALFAGAGLFFLFRC